MKKLVLLSSIMFSLLFLTGCGKSTPTDVATDQTTVSDTTVTTSEETKPSLTSRAQCVELMAYAFKMVEAQALGKTDDFNTWLQKAQKLQESYNMNDKEYEQVCGGLQQGDTSIVFEAQKRQKELK